MRRGTSIDEISAAALDFDWLVSALAPASAYGERAFARLRPFLPGEESAAQRRAQRVAAVAASVDIARLDALRDALRGAPDAAGAISRASMGDILGDANLLELQRCFDAVLRVDALLDGVPGIDACANESVRACARALELGVAGKFGFYLADGFDTHLAQTRAALTQAQAEYEAVRGRGIAAVSAALDRNDITGHEFIVMRSDLRAALPAGVRVVREATTYVLCELDVDEAALAALARRERAADAVAQAEERVRAALSEIVRSHAAALDTAIRAFGELDVLIAQARFTQVHGCVVAEIDAGARLRFEDGRFLPLAQRLKLQGRAFTPLAVDLGGVAVLTGPNMGGKSVCLRTCGFIALCAAFGLPVPARRARLPLFDDIAWLGIGTESELGGLLSSFAKEVVRLRELLERPATRRFMAIDEFARTTTPHEGKALLVALLSRLQSLGASAIVATHLGGVANQAGVRHFAVRGLRGIPQPPPAGDIEEALRALAESMDYTIAEVAETSEQESDAIALAELLGLDKRLICAAQRALETRRG